MTADDGGNGQAPGPWQELRELRGELSDLSNCVNQKVLPQLAQISAKVELSGERHSQEIAVLFREAKEHERRIGGIERAYVPREHCDKVHAENREEHKDFAKRQGATDVSVGRIAMVVGSISTLAATAVSTGAQALFAWFGKGH